MNDPMYKVKQLRKAIDDAIKDLNLDRITFTVMPGDKNDPDSIGLVFRIDPKALLSGDQLKFDNEFEKLIANIDEEENSEKKMQDVQKMIEQWIEDEE